jgi:hypothetical protein
MSRMWTFITVRVIIAEARGDPRAIAFAAIPSPMPLATFVPESPVEADIVTIGGCRR